MVFWKMKPKAASCQVEPSCQVDTLGKACAVASMFCGWRLGSMQYFEEAEVRLISKNVNKPYWQIPVYNRFADQIIGVIEIDQESGKATWRRLGKRRERW